MPHSRHFYFCPPKITIFSISILIILICTLLPPTLAIDTSITDNVCSFKYDGNLFSLALLNKKSSGVYYNAKLDDLNYVLFNFCEPFTPSQCSKQLATNISAFSFVVSNASQQKQSNCQAFSSNSKSYNFIASYNSTTPGTLNLTLSVYSIEINTLTAQKTIFILECSDKQKLSDISVVKSSANIIQIHARTAYACPIFQISSIWAALTDNSFIFGIVLFVLGFIMLFFGILMTHLMIFLASYFMSFALLIGIATAFIGPDSSKLVIYFTLLFILFLATVIAYSLTRLVNFSVFFIGAFFGFLLAAIVNAIFTQIFSITTVYSLIFFELIFTIPFGLLTFRYSNQIIILSTSFVGSYMLVRPISWILGGFPNQFTLYQMAQNGQFDRLTISFYFYLIVIIAIGVLGSLYQLLKLERQNTPHEEIKKNFITQNVEEHIDRIRDAVEKIITKYSPQNQCQDQYSKMQEMNSLQGPTQSVQKPKSTKQRKSRQNIF